MTTRADRRMAQQIEATGNLVSGLGEHSLANRLWALAGDLRRRSETQCERWWQPRRDGEATADYLGRVLDEVDHPDMARRARLAHFDDYFCPDDVDDGTNIVRLVTELGDWVRSATRDQRQRGLVVIEAAMDGEFDGTREEADRWAASPDGQATFRELLGRERPDDG